MQHFTFTAFGTLGCTHGEIRLVGGSGHNEGRVEICLLNEWGTVCNNRWSMNHAKVVCGQLGFNSVGKHSGPKCVHGYKCSYFSGAKTLTNFAKGKGKIWLEHVQCTGSETAITKCPFKKKQSGECTHDKDAAVWCPNGNKMRMILSIIDTLFFIDCRRLH